MKNLQYTYIYHVRWMKFFLPWVLLKRKTRERQIYQAVNVSACRLLWNSSTIRQWCFSMNRPGRDVINVVHLNRPWRLPLWDCDIIVGALISILRWLWPVFFLLQGVATVPAIRSLPQTNTLWKPDLLNRRVFRFVMRLNLLRCSFIRH
jgi:hypothetical protein